MASAGEEITQMAPGFSLAQAIAEAERCLLCHEAPCSRGCPCGTDPALFIRKLRFRNIKGAIRTIKNNNSLGGACGVLCPTALLCERQCSATPISSPIRIGKIQRALVEHGWDIGLQPYRPAAARRGRAAVVGSGPAGLSCAAELAKRGYAATIFEQREKPGGVIRYGVPSHRFDERFLERELHDIRALGVVFRCSESIDERNSVPHLLASGFDAVFVAHGLWEPIPAQAGRQPLRGHTNSIDFLSSLRTEDPRTLAASVEGRRVAVIGGGDVAMDCAQSALRLGAKDVYLIYRRTWAQMPATQEERIETEAAGVQFLLLNQPVDYVRNESGVLRGVGLIRTRLGEPDRDGRSAPVEVPGSEWVLEADLVIEAVGNQADRNSPQWHPGVGLSSSRRIVVDPSTGATDMPGVFAGGDIVRGPSLVVEAVQDGKVAARGIIQLLETKYGG